MARVQKPCSMHVLHMHSSSCLELVWIILLSLARVMGSLALHTTPFLVAIYKCRMLPWVKITHGMGGTLGLVMCMILTVSTSLSTSHGVSAHTVSTCIHICLLVYISSLKKMNPCQNCSPSPNILKLAAWKLELWQLIQRTYVRTYTETTDMGKYCMLLHSYIHGHCVVTNKINNVLLVCSSLDVFCLTFQYVSCHSI